MHEAQKKVRAFHRAMGHPSKDSPSFFGFRGQLRVDLIQEELDELADAIACKSLSRTIDAVEDLLYVVYGTAEELGFDAAPFFDEVHRSNMAKVGGGQRADGKQLKPEGWTPPDIAGLLVKLYPEAIDRTPDPIEDGVIEAVDLEDLQIHHRNGDPTNNQLDNLDVISARENQRRKLRR